MIELDEDILSIIQPAYDLPGGGRISAKTATKILELLSAWDEYNDLSKKTIKWTRRNLHWTPNADRAFRKAVKIVTGVDIANSYYNKNHSHWSYLTREDLLDCGFKHRDLQDTVWEW